MPACVVGDGETKYEHVTACAWRPDGNFQERILSVHSGSQGSNSSLSGLLVKCFYPLRFLTSPKFLTFCKNDEGVCGGTEIDMPVA